MTRRAAVQAVLLSILALICTVQAVAEKRRDPLTQAEVDQLRDSAQEPDVRLKLYVTFARSRLDGLQKVRTDPEVKDRPQETHNRLQDFLDVYDELSDNVDTFADRKDDIRKSLKLIIEAETEFQAKLRALKSAAGSAKDDARGYEFLLDDVLEAVDSGASDHRQLMAEQEDAAKHKKLIKPE